MYLACGSRCRGIPGPPTSSYGQRIDSNLSQGLKRSSSVACSPCTKFVREKQTKQTNKKKINTTLPRPRPVLRSGHMGLGKDDRPFPARCYWTASPRAGGLGLDCSGSGGGCGEKKIGW